MYSPVVAPCAAKLIPLSVKVAGAVLPPDAGIKFGSAWNTGSVPTTTIEPVTAGDHVVFLLLAARSGASSGEEQWASGNTIALNALKSAVVRDESQSDLHHLE